MKLYIFANEVRLVKEDTPDRDSHYVNDFGTFIQSPGKVIVRQLAWSPIGFYGLARYVYQESL